MAGMVKCRRAIVKGLTPAAPPAQRIAALCEETLLRNWREGVRRADGIRFAYTRPSPGHYPFQWYWDSCFAAIVWRRFDPARSRAELESLLAAQREDGFIGHTIFWDTPLDKRQRWTYNVLSDDAPTTASIQPPVLAWAWRIALGDPANEPRIARHYEWLARHRDLDGDGLIWIVHRTSPGWMPRLNSTPSGGAMPMDCPGSSSWCAGTGDSATTCAA